MIEEKLAILHDILGDFKRESKTQFLFTCPKCFHHKPKLAVNIQEDVFKCWICHWQGSSIKFLVGKLNRARLQEWMALDGEFDFSEDSIRLMFEELGAVGDEPLPPLSLPKEFGSFVSSKLPESAKPILAYLYRRGLADKDVWLWRLGYALSGKYENSVIVPSFDVAGNLNYFVSRNVAKYGKKYNNPPQPTNLVFNEMYVDWKKPVVIVEGVFDMFKAGAQAIPLLGSSFSEHSQLFQKIIQNNSEIIMALDPDAREKENAIIKQLLSYELNVCRVDLPKEKDVGDLTKEEFDVLKKAAKKATAETVLLEEFFCKL